MLDEGNAFTHGIIRLIKYTNKLYTILRIPDWQHLSIRDSTGSTSALIFRQSDVHFEYVVISYLQLPN